MKAAVAALCAALAAAAPELTFRQAPPPLYSLVCPGSTLTNYDIITISPAPRAYSCNKKGTLAEPSPLTALNTCSTPTLSTCRDTCISNNDCQSFSYDGLTQTCNMYSKTLAQQGFARTPQSTTNPPFYHRKCFTQVFSGNYVQNGDFEDGVTDSTDSNIHVKDWSVTKALGAHAAHIAYAPVSHAGSHSLSIECPLAIAPARCEFSLLQNIAGPSSKGAYKLVFNAAATAVDDPAVDPIVGVRMTPYFNNYMADRGTLYAFPCAKHEHCPVDPTGMTWYPFNSLWYSMVEESAPLRFAISMPAGYQIYLDDVTFEFDGEALPPQKRAVDVSLRRIAA